MTRIEIQELLERPYNQNDWKDFLQSHFTNNKLYGEVQTIQLAQNPISKHCVTLGNYEVDDFTKIGIFEIQINDKVNITRNRVALRNILKDITAQVAGAMVVFVQGDKWRFSYISKRKVKNKNTNLIEDKETAPKRFTYLFGKGEKARTASDRFEKLINKQQQNIFQLLSLNDFEEAFSVEALSKDFFKKYKDTYEDFVEYLTGKRYKKQGNKFVEQEVTEPNHQLKELFKSSEPEREARDFCKRMMGRIVFLYFIQKKGWLAVPQSKNWGEGNMNYLYDLFKNSNNEDNFYSKELVPLFFTTLNDVNSENEDRTLRFPYLNGGLFDNTLDEKYNELKLPKIIFEKLFKYFNDFNFTIHEDAPDEQTVAVDPEMLGHIFENLLEDNKDKGAFYTPKEIVHYMCQESLKEYLVSNIDFNNDRDKIGLSTIDKIIHQVEIIDDEKQFAEKNAYKIIDALENVKICDPAIGSGAFPMGLLQEIFNAQIYLQELKGFKKINEAEIKKHIIQESIYGVDIDAGAVDIARLRFWLSLVVDEERPQPLPNLDFKIMQGNSLLGIPYNSVIDVNADLKFEEYKEKYFEENNPEKKKELKEKINYYIQKILNTANEFSSYEINFDFKLFFSEVYHGDNNGFDIVIGNPPYGAKLSSDEKALFKEMYSDVHMRTPDTFNYFISKSFKLLKENGVLSYIVPNNLLFQGENTKTRSLLINTHCLKTVINLGDNAFENADVPTCIFVGLKGFKANYTINFSDNRKLQVQEMDFATPQKTFLNTDVNDVPDMVIGISGKGVKLMREIETKSWKLDDIALEMASGISTGNDKVFRIEKQLAEDNNFEKEILKPVLVGGDIDKYKINYKENVLIYTARDTEIESFPIVKNYLFEFKNKLEQRSETKQGILPWYALGRQRYSALFDEEKIIMRQTSDSIRATYDNKGYYTLNSVLVFKITPQFDISYKYALMMLNSKLNNYVYKSITQEEGRTFAEVKPQNVRKLFIPKISKEDQKVFEILCDYLMFLNDDTNKQVVPGIENRALALFIQEVADVCVIELIYGSEMKNNKVNVLEFVKKEITSFQDLPWEVRQAREIFESYQKWTLPNSEVRNRLKIVSVILPDTAGIILSDNV